MKARIHHRGTEGHRGRLETRKRGGRGKTRATGLVLRPNVLLPEYGRFLGELCGSVVRIRGQRKMWGRGCRSSGCSSRRLRSFRASCVTGLGKWAKMALGGGGKVQRREGLRPFPPYKTSGGGGTTKARIRHRGTEGHRGRMETRNRGGGEKRRQPALFSGPMFFFRNMADSSVNSVALWCGSGVSGRCGGRGCRRARRRSGGSGGWRRRR